MKERTRSSNGFALLALLIFIALLGVVGLSLLQLGALADQRDAEDELLHVGAQYRRALQLYVEATPPGQPRFPAKLDFLLRDPRYPLPRRYLRRLYLDPVTQRFDWVLMLSPEGGVMGVHSSSQKEPVRQVNFVPPFEQFNRLKKYSEWVFYYYPDIAPGLSMAPVPSASSAGTPAN